VAGPGNARSSYKFNARNLCGGNTLASIFEDNLSRSLEIDALDIDRLKSLAVSVFEYNYQLPTFGRVMVVGSGSRARRGQNQYSGNPERSYWDVHIVLLIRRKRHCS
jgi:hypothetical protein